MEQEYLFKLKNLTVQFASRSQAMKRTKYINALRDISLDIPANESVGIIGESGSGKTTLIRTLMGLQVPTNGEIYFKGEKLSDYLKKSKKDYLKEIQFVFQDPKSSLNSKISIGTQLRTPLKCLTNLLDDEIDSRIDTVLKSVRMDSSCLTRKPSSFSGGQAQRIAIARALLTKPKLIILDEAVSALDVSVQATILNLLRDLKEIHGVQFIFVGHDIATVEYLCPTLVVMKDGVIVEKGTREDIISNPQQSYTQELISSIYQVN